MWKTILVPLDGSSSAEVVLPYVEKLVSQHESRIIFLSVIEPAVFYPFLLGSTFSIPLEERIRQEEKAQVYLSELQGRFCARGIDARSYVAHGRLVETIIDFANLYDVDIIVLAIEKRSRFTNYFSSNVQNNIIKKFNQGALLLVHICRDV